MTENWSVLKLGDLCKFQAGGAFPKSEQGHKIGDYPFIKVSDMTLPANGTRIVAANNWVSEDTAARMKLKFAPTGSVAFAKIGEGLKAERLREITRPTAMDNNMMAAVPNSGAVDPRFLRFLLESVHLASWAEGSALPYLRQKDLAEIPVTVPIMNEQRAIAATLGALDDKIDSNRRAINKAQEIGDALFASLLGERRAVSDVATITMGTSPKSDVLNDAHDGTPFYQGKRDFGFRFPSVRIWTTNPIRFARRNDTLMSVRAPVGELNRAAVDCCVGRGVAAIHSENQPSTLYYAMRASRSAWDKFQGEGTVFASANKKDVHDAEIFWVADQHAEQLEQVLSSLDQRVESLDAEIQKLSALRETLLPELLSGSVSVPTEEGQA